MIFDEDIFPFEKRYKDYVELTASPLLKAWQSAPLEPNYLPTAYAPPRIPNIVQQEEHVPTETEETEEPVQEESVSEQQAAEAESSAPMVDQTHPMTTRLQRGIRKPNPQYDLVASKDIPTISRTTAVALKHEGWTSSMTEEMDAQRHNGTMSLVPRRPNMNVLGSRWIHTIKMNPDGTVLKLKSRWVAKGYEQELGVDFVQVFSHVVRTSTIRVVLGIVVAKDWRIRQLMCAMRSYTVNCKRKCFVEQPPGSVDPAFPDHVCKLHKALYGLKQAQRAWFNKFTNFLLDFGFKCSPDDPSLFTYHQGNRSLALLMYVDDVFITGNTQSLIDDLVTALSRAFSMKDMGDIHYFFGIQARYTEHGMFLDQLPMQRKFSKRQTWLLLIRCLLHCPLVLMLRSNTKLCFLSRRISVALQANCNT